MRMRLLSFFWFLVMPAILFGHEIRPGYLEIKATADQSLSITWKQPIMGAYGLPLHPSLSSGWLQDSLSDITYTETYLIKRWNIPHSLASLDQQTITIDGLDKTITDVLVQIKGLNDQTYTYLIKPIQPYVKLNLSIPQPPPVWQYVYLGIHHIWTGFDHLLFVFGLLLLVKKKSTLIWTITAFTIAHSLTLALATFDLVNVTPVFTESAIALSIVFLAVEIVHQYHGHQGLMSRYPWFVSFCFGLLHGLGFAGALRDVGLPQHDIPLALFLFNAGVEIGQLVFVLLALIVLAGIRRMRIPISNKLQYVPAYAIGALAMFWFIERLAPLFTI